MAIQIPRRAPLSAYSSPRWPALTSSRARFRGPSGRLVLLLLLNSSLRTRGLQLLPTPAVTQGLATATRDGSRPTHFGRRSGQAKSMAMCDMQMKPSGTSETAGGVAVVPGSRPLSVAVIGAGAAGLAAGRVLRDEGLRVTILEKSHHVGGVWRYKPEPDARAPMYRSLVTNLPKETMSFLGFPFPENVQSFATHGQVLDYLCSYADQHDLHPLMKLGCPVESIRPISRDSPPVPNGNSVNVGDGSDEMPPVAAEGDEGRGGHDGPEAFARWEVVYRRDSDNGSTREHAGKTSNGGGNGDAAATAGADSRSMNGEVGPSAAAGSTTVVETFDAVCVCNGHFDKPFVPQAEGFEGFQGTSMHAYAYDTPDVEAFAGRRVLCVGSRSSGADIAREVSSVASVVHVCDRAASESLRGGERGNVWWRPTLEKFEGANVVRFKDGTSAEVDTVVWCTGYSYSFPFLEGSGLLTPPSKLRVHPLYEQLFHVKHPSLTFVGLPQSIVPFPLFEVQANAVAAVIGGRSSLPPLAEREQWLKNEEETGQRERSISPTSRAVHVLHGLQWAYLRRLLRLAGPGAVARPPWRSPEAVAAGVGVNGDARGDNAGAISFAGSPGGAGLGKGTLPSQARVAADERQEKEEDNQEEELLRALEVREAMYKDASGSRSKFPGAPDDYRLREYRVDRESASFSVSLAERKANGEDPSAAVAAAAAIASLGLTDEPAEA